MAIQVRPLSRPYVNGAVEMHLFAFQNFFLSFLGRGFLRQLYGCAAGHPLTVGYVAVDEKDKVVGACFGVINGGAFYKSILKRRWWAFAWYSMWAVLRRPMIIPRLLRALRFRGNPPPISFWPLGTLISTAVEPGTQGTGAAIALMRAVCDEYVRRGVHAVFLTTDADNNDMVRGFYLRMGWQFVDYYTTPEGRRMCWYIWKDPKYDWQAHPNGEGSP